MLWNTIPTLYCARGIGSLLDNDEIFDLPASFIFSWSVIISEGSDNEVHSLIRTCFCFVIAFFWGHAMPWDLMYGISNHHWAVLLFVVVAPFGVWSQYTSPFEVILYHIVSVWEKMQTWFTLFWWETLLKDSFTELSHTQGHQGFSQIASGFKSKISRRLLDCHWHGLDPRVVIAWFDLSLLKEDDPGRSLSSQSGSHLECVMMRKSSFASGVIDNKRRAVVDTEMGWCC